MASKRKREAKDEDGDSTKKEKKLKVVIEAKHECGYCGEPANNEHKGEWFCDDCWTTTCERCGDDSVPQDEIYEDGCSWCKNHCCVCHDEYDYTCHEDTPKKALDGTVMCGSCWNERAIENYTQLCRAKFPQETESESDS
jgi:hypothetical protein